MPSLINLTSSQGMALNGKRMLEEFWQRDIKSNKKYNEKKIYPVN